MRPIRPVIATLALILAGGAPAPAAETDPPAPPLRAVQQGVAIEARLAPVSGAPTPASLVESERAVVTLGVSDAATGSPMAGLRPAAWIQPRPAGSEIGPTECRAAVTTLLGSSIGSRPAVDLNVYHVLALNADPSITVIDPLLGFGGSKTVALVRLRSPGEDWVLARDGKRLFVSLPGAGQVAVVDTTTWRVTAGVETGAGAARLALQADGKYLWVATASGPGGGGSLVAIDLAKLAVAARLPVGAGPHDLALSPDDRYLFATSTGAGAVTVVDTGRLAVDKTVPVGRRPVAVAYSAAGQAAYVAEADSGEVVVVDGRRHEVRARIALEPGLVGVRFPATGRLGFAVNRAREVVHVFDTATDRAVHTVDVGPQPDWISFSESFAYVRARGSDRLTLIPLANLGRGGPVSVVDVAGTLTSVGAGGPAALADPIIPALEGGAVLIASPIDRTVFYYKEGMAAPMGSFRNSQRQPRAIMVVDRSLRETAPGLYSAPVELPSAGEYMLAVLVDSPRVVQCFPLTVAAAPDRSPFRRGLAVEVVGEKTIPAGAETRVRLRVTDAASRAPQGGLTDLRVVAVMPGNWQERGVAVARDDGLYEVPLRAPRPGVYFLYFEVPSLKLRFNQTAPVVLNVTGGSRAAGEKTP